MMVHFAMIKVRLPSRVCWFVPNHPRRLEPKRTNRTWGIYAMRGFSFCIDRGGTFTDVFAEIPINNGNYKYRTLKLLSEDPSHYEDAPIEGIRRILEDELQEEFPRDSPIKTDHIKSIRMGTTVATNALLERKGERMALVVSKGFKDLLHIGNQSRPDIFDLTITCPEVLYEMVVEVDEQVRLSTFQKDTDAQTIKGVTGELGIIHRPLDLDEIRNDLKGVLRRGIKSLAVVFKHAAIFPDHELQVGAIAKELEFEQISLSHQVMPMVKMVPRGFTAAADAYLTPHIKKYINGFKRGFDEGLEDVQVLFMQSDGGLAQVEDFSGHRAILSGPAGGYVGYANLTRWQNQSIPQHQIIGFDMGGTSTDVSRFDGHYEHVYESITAGIAIQAPQLDINTVAAGGGSRLFFNSGMLVVGPESAGAHPGPVCYQKGGPLTITDANVVLGRIVPEYFPKIFGPNEDQPLDVQGAYKALEDLTEEVNRYAKEHNQSLKSVEEVAIGCITVANETMSRPIRALTQMKGHDLTKHVLSSFGGAGGQHACALARSLGIPTVFVHKYASILSAVGMGVADVVHEEQTPFDGSLDHDLDNALGLLDQLQTKAGTVLKSKGFERGSMEFERFLNLRYRGTDVAIMILETSGSFHESFVQRYKKEFGFTLDREILIDDVRVRSYGKTRSIISNSLESNPPINQSLPGPSLHQEVYFEDGGFLKTPVYELTNLPALTTIPGPALLIDEISSILVEPNCTAYLTEDQNLRIEIQGSNQSIMQPISGVECDPIQLAIFSHRFMSIAEQMGRTLQRTSVSVNIKERLDYSCALFGPDGGLVANAPHLPVHLGAMSEAVKYQIKYYGPGGPGEETGLNDGDVLVSNHPKAGGSHLPDITVITPVFSDNQIVFFAASRGHHADVGGISPGSMPPLSKTLVDEGASIISFKLIEAGPNGALTFDEEGIKELLMRPGKGPGPKASGARVLNDNMSDLRAQAAANNQGIRLIQELIGLYSLRVVQAYMLHIRNNAEQRVREMLIKFSEANGLAEIGTVQAQDQMDDGTQIALTVTIDRTNGSAEFDFTGTGLEVLGNCNAPPAVTYSAIIYSLRCMVRKDIPLNQGCLKPITVLLPEGCILNPSDDAAVCGGNVLTSQRVTDVVLKAFNAAAASQGCMNNFTFGNENLVYFETIGGGAGAGPEWHGRSGVQVHMTNTRITDPEILEQRYPVVLNRYHLRRGSGGHGKWRGGDGITREVEFLQPLNACVLCERRSTRPFGLCGGSDALPGVNLLKKADGRVISIGGKAELNLEPGECIIFHTPGGGGFGGMSDSSADSGFSSSQEDGNEISTGVPYRVGGSVVEYQRLMEQA